MKNRNLLLASLSLVFLTGCGILAPKVSNLTPKSTSAANPPSPSSSSAEDPIKPILDHSAKTMQTHFFDNADSVWIDGDWHFNNNSDARYIATFYGLPNASSQPVIEELDMNSTANPNYTEFVCPRNIGHLTITKIQPNGTIVDFSSTSGVKGSLDLRTKAWSFKTS